MVECQLLTRQRRGLRSHVCGWKSITYLFTYFLIYLFIYLLSYLLIYYFLNYLLIYFLIYLFIYLITYFTYLLHGAESFLRSELVCS